jgi:hypothetical protein
MNSTFQLQPQLPNVTFKCSNWLYGAYVTRHTQWERHCTLYFRGHETQVSVGKTNWKRSLLFRMPKTNPLDYLWRGIWRSFHCDEAEDIFNTRFQLLYASWHTFGKCVLREAAETKEQTRGPRLPLSFDMTLSLEEGEKNASAYLTATLACSTNYAIRVSLFRAVPLRNSTA